MSSIRNKEFFCQIRKKKVVGNSEEEVRQELLAFLQGPFGCPPHNILVETSLQSLLSIKVPKRRLDVVCLYRVQDALLPLLVIECKVNKPKLKENSQIGGYNLYLQAPFQALVWKDCCCMRFWEKNIYEGPIYSMPLYRDLIERAAL